MFTITVPKEIALRTLAFGFHEAIRNNCLDKFLAVNDITELLNIKIENRSVLGLLALNQNNEGILKLLQLGALPINVSYDYYHDEISDITHIFENCSQEVYYYAIDALITQFQAGNVTLYVLYNVFTNVFTNIYPKIYTIDGELGCRYFLNKLIEINRLAEVINYSKFLSGSLLDIANQLYTKYDNIKGYQILFEYGISLETRINSDSTLKDHLRENSILNKLYMSYQIEIKEPQEP